MSPFVLDTGTGDVKLVSGEANIQQALVDLISTGVGERLMNEDLGTQTSGMLFENPVVVADLLPRQIRDAISRFEPRVTNVRVAVEQIDEATVTIRITYVIRATGVEDTFTINAEP